MTDATKKTAPKSAPSAGKTAAAKAPAAKPAAKAAVKSDSVDKPKAGNKPNALQQPLQPSAELAAVVGEGKLARGEVVKRVWDYIKSNKLQNPSDGREILADDKLKKVFNKDKVTMFEMNKLLAQNLK